MKTLLAALALLSATAVSPLVGQTDDESSRQTLTGLKGVHVVMGPVGDEMQHDGLDTAQARTAVELRLREAGIPVLTNEQTLLGVDEPILFINVNALKGRTIPLYGFSVNIEVYQEMCLMRNPSVKVKVATWSVGTFGTVGPGNFGSTARQVIRDGTDRFINAYLATNPKR